MLLWAQEYLKASGHDVNFKFLRYSCVGVIDSDCNYQALFSRKRDDIIEVEEQFKLREAYQSLMDIKKREPNTSIILFDLDHNYRGWSGLTKHLEIMSVAAHQSIKIVLCDNLRSIDDDHKTYRSRVIDEERARDSARYPGVYCTSDLSTPDIADALGEAFGLKSRDILRYPQLYD